MAQRLAQDIHVAAAPADAALGFTIKLIGLVHALKVPTSKEHIFDFIDDYKAILLLSPLYQGEEQEGFSSVLRAVLTRFISGNQPENDNTMALTAQLAFDDLGPAAHLNCVALDDLLLKAAYNGHERRHLISGTSGQTISSLPAFHAYWRNMRACRRLRILGDDLLLSNLILAITGDSGPVLAQLAREWQLQPPRHSLTLQPRIFSNISATYRSGPRLPTL